MLGVKAEASEGLGEIEGGKEDRALKAVGTDQLMQKLARDAYPQQLNALLLLAKQAVGGADGEEEGVACVNGEGVLPDHEECVSARDADDAANVGVVSLGGVGGTAEGGARKVELQVDARGKGI